MGAAALRAGDVRHPGCPHARQRRHARLQPSDSTNWPTCA